MSPEQIAVLSGGIAFAIISLLKLIPAVNCTPALTKIISTIVAATLTVLIAASWQINGQVVWQIALAIMTALGSYQALGKPLRKAINKDEEDG